MKLRILILLTFAGAALGEAQESTKTAKIDEIFRLMKVDQVQKQMIGQIQAMTAASMAQAGVSPEAQQKGRALNDKVLAAVMQAMSWDKLRPVYVKMYDETFTEDEISGMLLFYLSNAGQAYLNKMPMLQMKTMEFVQERMKTLMPEILKLTKDSAAGATVK